jgi:hypothetical protein
MSADSCIFCLELLSKATDRNLVDGNGKLFEIFQYLQV